MIILKPIIKTFKPSSGNTRQKKRELSGVFLFFKNRLSVEIKI